MSIDPHHLPRHVEQMIEQQIRRWELERRARDEQRRADEAVDLPWPVITVSREFGSQGAAVGKIVAEAMGFSYWNQELVHEVAERAGAREALVASLDEHVRSRIDDFIAHVFRGGKGASDEYVRQVGHVIHTLERHGGAVIVGRGGQFVVDPEAALRVRFVCPRDERVLGYAKRRGMSVDEAARKVDATERDRQAFFKKYYERDVTDPLHYDVVINVGGLDLAEAGQLVKAAYQAKFKRTPG